MRTSAKVSVGFYVASASMMVDFVHIVSKLRSGPATFVPVDIPVIRLS